MATRRKPAKRRRSKQDDRAAEELALADELERVSRREEAGLIAGWDRFMKELGIHGKPIGAKKLQEMALREGVKPGDKLLSRAIIEMREE